MVAPHARFLALGRNDTERCEAYRELVRLSISDDDLQAIRDHIQQHRVLGTSRLQAAIEAMSGRHAQAGLAGSGENSAGRRSCEQMIGK